MFPGETIATGAPAVCPDCGTRVEYEVLMSAAGYYVGTMCKCQGGSPYTRDSGYYKTRAQARDALLEGTFHRE